jgi:hypothetical protein
MTINFSVMMAFYAPVYFLFVYVLTSTSFLLGITVFKHLQSSASLSAPTLYPISQEEVSCGLLDGKRRLVRYTQKALHLFKTLSSRVEVPLKHFPRHATFIASVSEERKQRTTH